jgi:Ser/Thr protein kinase RdoA (MazF antagonist)
MNRRETRPLSPEPPGPSAHPYDRLTPDVLTAAMETLGFRPDGRLLALNSYENRVYQIGMETGPPLIAKFYRPDRLSTAAIAEEHDFALELASAEVPVVPPIQQSNRTLFEHEGFRFAIFERRGGHWPELGSEQEREWMGRFIGRIHAIGRARRFRHRPDLTVARLGDESREFLLNEGWIPDHLLDSYESVSGDLLDAVQTQFEASGAFVAIRLHGDCHPGNVLWTDDGPHFVDLDDCLQGPAVQDLWMLLSGTRRDMGEQLRHLLQGYAQFADFDYAELNLVEALRSLRIMHYAAWLARRWSDPAFPLAFPWFAETRYWETHVLNLREQLAAVQEGPLSLA